MCRCAGAESWLGDGKHADLEFSLHNRPYLTASHAGDPGWEAADEDAVKAMQELLLAVVTAQAAGRTGTEVRRIVEIALIRTLIEGPIGSARRRQGGSKALSGRGTRQGDRHGTG